MIQQIKTITPNCKSQTTGNFFTVVELVNGQKLYAWKDTVKQALMSIQPGQQADFRLKSEGTQYPSIEDVVPVYQNQTAPAAQTGFIPPGSPPNQWEGQTQQLPQNVQGPGTSAPVNQPDPPAPVVADPKQESIERAVALKAAVDAVGAFQAMLWNDNPTQGAIQETILHFQQAFLLILKGKVGGAK